MSYMTDLKALSIWVGYLKKKELDDCKKKRKRNTKGKRIKVQQE